MTRKGLFGVLGGSSSSLKASASAAASADDDQRRSGRRETGPAPVEKNPTLPVRIPSAKKLPSVDEVAPGASSVVAGRFSSVEEKGQGESSGLPPRLTDDSSGGQPRQLLTRAESSKSLRRGTPRPQELTKSLSMVKFVLEQSGLDQVKEDESEEPEEKGENEVA